MKLLSEVENDPPRLQALVRVLRKAAPQDAASERAILEQAAAHPAKAGPEAPQGIRVRVSRGKVVLSGGGVTPKLVAELKAWLEPRGYSGKG